MIFSRKFLKCCRRNNSVSDLWLLILFATILNSVIAIVVPLIIYLIIRLHRLRRKFWILKIKFQPWSRQFSLRSCCSSLIFMDCRVETALKQLRSMKYFSVRVYKIYKLLTYIKELYSFSALCKMDDEKYYFVLTKVINKMHMRHRRKLNSHT